MEQTPPPVPDTLRWCEAVFSNAPSAICIMDVQSRVLRVNRRYEELFGWPEQEAIGKVINVIPPWLMADYQSDIQRVLDGHPVTVCTDRLHRRGHALPVEASVYPLFGQAKECIGMVSFFRDRSDVVDTSSRLAQAELTREALRRRSDRLAAAAAVAAGMAHEILNPLTTTVGFLQLWLNDVPSSPSSLQLVLSEMRKIERVIGEFLALSKPMEDDLEQLCAGTVLRQAAASLQDLAVSQGVNVCLQIASTPPLFGVASELKQVLTTLIRNAIEASSGGSTVELRCEGEGPAVLFRVIDHGLGMTVEQLRLAGEPFLSGKESGRGIGLLMGEQIAARHGGEIEFISAPGQGTTVTLRLPGVTQTAAITGTTVDEGA